MLQEATKFISRDMNSTEVRNAMTLLGIPRKCVCEIPQNDGCGSPSLISFISSRAMNSRSLDFLSVTQFKCGDFVCCVLFRRFTGGPVLQRLCDLDLCLLLVYGCETWSVTLREEHRPMAFQNRVLRETF